MREREPSRTAFAAAAHRAAHQELEGGRIFADPLAVRILGPDRRPTEEAHGRLAGRPMRFFIACRSRFAETALKTAVEARGVTQMVVLGAGLDTFAYRNPFEEGLRVFEADHPDTQAWKRRRLAEAGIAVPDTLAFVAVDFERDRLVERLASAGFDPGRRAFFIWLGVVPYLSEAAVRSTLQTIVGLPGGAEVVFDYAEPPGMLSPQAQARLAEIAERVASAGEPFLSYFERDALHDHLRGLGFAELEDLGVQALLARYADLPAPEASRAAKPGRPPRDRGGHVIHAATSFDG